MTAEDAGRAAVLLGALGLVVKDRAEIREKYLSENMVTLTEIYLPPAVWLEILGSMRLTIVQHLQDLGIDVSEALK